MAVNAYYNGIFTNKSEVRLPLTDRSVFFGDGIYEAAIGRNGNIFMLNEHIERFYSNAAALALPLAMKRAELCDMLSELIEKAKEPSFFIYFQLSRFSEERLHAYPDTRRSNLLATVSPFSLADGEKTLKLALHEDKRHRLCNIKTLNLLPAVIASHEAEAAGADEALFIRNGIITECSHSNVHILKDGVIFTHPLDECILPGISRLHMISVCKRLGIPVEEKRFGKDELFSADEVIVTSSSKLGVRVREIEGAGFSVKRGTAGDEICEAMRRDFLSKTQ